MDGIQFVSTVRERQRISWTPIILLTAKSAEDARVEGLVGRGSCTFLQHSLN